MNRTPVKCFKGFAQVGMHFNIEVLYTVPDFYHTKLFTCIECGELFCADQEDVAYSPKPFDVVISNRLCPKCFKPLAKTLMPYPQSFRIEDGIIGHYEPSHEIPDDKDSVRSEFWDLYS